MRRTAARLLLTALALSLLALQPRSAAAFGGVGDMFVTGDVSNTVRTYGGVSGSFLGLFGSPSNSPLAIDFGANNGRVLVGGFSGMQEFDATTGAFIKNYGPPGWAWSGIYAPNGNALVASTSTDQIIEYDVVTGAFVQVFATFPATMAPSDMAYGPNGNLYVGGYGTASVYELHPVTGAVQSAWFLPPGSRTNDVAFLNGEILVTALGTNKVFRYDSSPVHNLLGFFAGTSWGNTHGIAISPHNGHIYVVDGVSAQTHEFDPLTFVELNANVLTPAPGDKVVDIEFRPEAQVTPAEPTTWGRLKRLYR